LMMGQEHPHWLELLGFERFQSAWEIGLNLNTVVLKVIVR
jgi:hypothetical protein